MTGKKKKTDHSDLPPLELAVMDIIWELGECGSREVIDAYNAAAARPLADTTVRTVIASLRRKGYVEPVPTIDHDDDVPDRTAADFPGRNTLGKQKRQQHDGRPRRQARVSPSRLFCASHGAFLLNLKSRVVALTRSPPDYLIATA